MTDDELMLLLNSTSNDQKRALRFLYQGKGQEFGRYFRRSALSQADADECVQDTILKILRNCKSYSAEGTVNSWMWAIARNVLIDRIRSSKRSLEDTKSDEEWSKHEKVSATSNLSDLNSNEIEGCVSNGIQIFSIEDPERAYVISLHVDGLDGKEIAERIGRTHDATRQYLLQCRQKLAPYISHCVELLGV
jgi:RNA polymerase sigma factor (sigma-70 family)